MTDPSDWDVRYVYLDLVGFHEFHVGKCTVRPMDPSWVHLSLNKNTGKATPLLSRARRDQQRSLLGVLVGRVSTLAVCEDVRNVAKGSHMFIHIYYIWLVLSDEQICKGWPCLYN